MLGDWKRCEDERRELIDGVLCVIVREEKQSRLPSQLRIIAKRPRRAVGGREAELLRELEGIFGVVARDQRRRGVVEIGHILRPPVDEPGRAGKRDRPGHPAHQHGRAEDVAIGPPLEIARRRKGILAQQRDVVQGVVAVACALRSEDQATLPGGVRHPEHLRLAREGRPGIDVVAGHRVHREAVAVHLGERKADAEPVVDHRAADRAANAPGAVIAERRRQHAVPPRRRRPGAGDVDEAAERVAPVQRALRAAHELDLIDVEQLDARRVGVQLRHAVEVGRDPRVVRARADAPETGAAQLPGRPLGEVGVGREDRRLAHDADARALERFGGNGGHADRDLLLILWFLQRRDGDRGDADADLGILLRRARLSCARGLGVCQCWNECQNERRERQG